jgi:predicted transcriptional regulator
MNTTEIANAFGKGLTAVFYHLNMLAEAQILNTRSKGRTVLYRVNMELFNNFALFIKEFSVNKDARL